MSINNLDIDVYENGEWHSLKKGDGNLTLSYLIEILKKLLYLKKVRKWKKNDEWVAKQKENVEQKSQKLLKKVQEVVEEKAQEVVEEKAQEVVEEKAQEVVERKHKKLLRRK